jgi:hypothetical protein
MSTLLTCYNRLLTDISQVTGVTLVAPVDLGIHWITIGGPALDKELLLYLENEDFLVEPTYCLLFPKWLKPLWDRYLSNKDAVLIKYIRQVLVFGYKARFEPTDYQKSEAEASFINTELQVGDFERSLAFESHFWRSARAIVARVIGAIDWLKIIPFHGPGAVFPRFDPSERSDFKTIHTNIDAYYNFWDYFDCLPGFRPTASDINTRDIEVSSSPIKGKLVYVPKDSRGPRTICVHPRESIWIQQGQRVLLERAIINGLDRHINFDDQSVNSNIALASSLSREYCTLDLKDASDRLGCRVVRHLLGDYAYGVLSCTRMEEVILPSGRVVTLNKWAPMGNALCFPVESLVFYALARTGIESKHGRKAGFGVYVFGDDICVPSQYYVSAVEGLERAGLLVNKNKSFSRGFFRESCGVDAFKGIDVTPLRMKLHKVTSLHDLVSLCAFAKQMRQNGYEEVASYLYTVSRRFLSRFSAVLPLSNNPDSGGIYEYVERNLAYIIRNNQASAVRWNRSYHRYEVRVILPSASTTDGLNARTRFQDSLLSLERRATASKDGREAEPSSRHVYPVPHRVKLKKRWTLALWG